MKEPATKPDGRREKMVKAATTLSHEIEDQHANKKKKK
jgi:hypothetical protein